jgi:hypothetical protein
VLKRFKAKGGVLMRADITSANPPAESLLDSLGNTGHAIPFLAVFPGDKPDEPRTLEDFNPFNPGEYRNRLFKILDECPDPPNLETAQVR